MFWERLRRAPLVGLAAVISGALIAQFALAGDRGSGGGSQATISISKQKLKSLIRSEVAKQVAKATGPQGVKGQPGAPGQAGTSIFESTIPSGMTVRGAFNPNDFANDADGSATGVEAVSFPIPAPADLTASQVNFAPNANANDDDATCTGSSGAPTAPPGKVCLYMDGYAGGAAGASGEIIESGAGSRFGFVVVVTPGNAANPSQAAVDGNWAYTAP